MREERELGEWLWGNTGLPGLTTNEQNGLLPLGIRVETHSRVVLVGITRNDRNACSQRGNKRKRRNNICILRSEKQWFGPSAFAKHTRREPDR